MPRGPFIQTFTGREFYPFDVQPEMIHIEDIAHALSMTCRYTGHCPHFYSVAEHSVYVANQALVNWNDQLRGAHYTEHEVRMQGLLHDASEAYISDLSQPIKHTPEFQFYRAFEKHLQEKIYMRFGLLTKDLDCVRLADRELLTAESCTFWGPKAKRWTTFQEQAYRMPVEWGWSPVEAKAKFLAAFIDCGGKIK